MTPATKTADPFVRSVVLKRDEVDDFDAYPFSIPAIRRFDELQIDPHVTLFAGENGSGKSTLVEAIAVAAGFNAEGGSRHVTVSTRASHSVLYKQLRLVRGTRRPRTGYFLRAESFFNVATHVEEVGGPPSLRTAVDPYTRNPTASPSSRSLRTGSGRAACTCSTSRKRPCRCAGTSR